MNKPSNSKPDRTGAAAYEIRLEGHLDARWAARLDVASLTHEGGATLLRAAAADQSALHGLLQRIRDLGLTLISVTRLTPDQPADLSATDKQGTPT